MRTRFADTAQHADAFFVIRAISNTKHVYTSVALFMNLSDHFGTFISAAEKKKSYR